MRMAKVATQNNHGIMITSRHPQTSREWFVEMSGVEAAMLDE